MLIHQASTVSATVLLMRCRGRLRLRSSAVCQSRFLLFMYIDSWNETLHVELGSKHSVWSQGKLGVSEQLPQHSATWESSGSSGRSWGQRYICPSPALWHMVLYCQETLTDFPAFSPNCFLKAFRRNQFIFSGDSSSNNLLSREQKNWVHFLLFPKRTPTHCHTMFQTQDWKISLSRRSGDDDPEGKL